MVTRQLFCNEKRWASITIHGAQMHTQKGRERGTNREQEEDREDEEREKNKNWGKAVSNYEINVLTDVIKEV